MKPLCKHIYPFVSAQLFLVLPLLIVTTGDFPHRPLAKDFISILTVAAFFAMTAQFYSTRMNKEIMAVYPTSRIVQLHKIIGYTAVGVLLLHPLFVVAHKYFEPGTSPREAFVTLITSAQSTGVIMGIISWFLLLFLAVTSFLRHKMGVGYKHWRLFHGVTSVALLATSSWHVVNSGRHSNWAMCLLIVCVAVIGTGKYLNLLTENRPHSEGGTQ